MSTFWKWWVTSGAIFGALLMMKTWPMWAVSKEDHPWWGPILLYLGMIALAPITVMIFWLSCAPL